MALLNLLELASLLKAPPRQELYSEMGGESTVRTIRRAQKIISG